MFHFLKIIIPVRFQLAVGIYLPHSKVRLLYKPGCAIVCVGNLTEEKSRETKFEFPIDILITKACLNII
jgi:hypothetical protein